MFEILELEPYKKKKQKNQMIPKLLKFGYMQIYSEQISCIRHNF